MFLYTCMYILKEENLEIILHAKDLKTQGRVAEVAKHTDELDIYIL